jgi:hypothetical protein
MPSAFPGMDPYLEDPAVWPGLHDSLIVYCRDALQPLLLPGYYVEIRERVYFEQSRDVIYPDATLHKRRPTPVSAGGAAVVTADEPTILRTETRQRESFLEIRSVGAREVVTVIEFISPANKYGAGQGREEYREKQEQVLGSRASLVEIDLLRRGSPVVAAPPGELLTLRRFDYLSCVSRAGDRGHVEVYAVTLRERLPRVAIPLREPDPDVVLDLPSIFAHCYDNGAYAVRVDYNPPPPKPFRPDDEAWADALLRSAGLRGESSGGERP